MQVNGIQGAEGNVNQKIIKKILTRKIQKFRL